MVGRFLNHSNIEAVLNKRQPGDSPPKTNQSHTHIYIYIKRRERLDETVWDIRKEERQSNGTITFSKIAQLLLRLNP